MPMMISVFAIISSGTYNELQFLRMSLKKTILPNRENSDYSNSTFRKIFDYVERLRKINTRSSGTKTSCRINSPDVTVKIQCNIVQGADQTPYHLLLLTIQIFTWSTYLNQTI